MSPIVSIRPAPTAARSASRWAACGKVLPRLSGPSIRTLYISRGIATNAAVQEPNVDFPGPPGNLPPAPQQSLQQRKDAIKSAKPFSAFLTDTFNRQHDYLRISITERCNLRCLYCMPEEGVPLSPPAHLLTTPEIVYLSSLFVSQGVTKIRLTGGEPTVRRDVLPLMHQIGALRSKGLKELALTTNGISLHRKLDSMVEAGLTGVNLSLDTLDPYQFQIMTRRKGFEAVMKCIERILEMNKRGAGVKLKVNCVVMRGLNERDIIPFVELGREKDIEVRFIEYMPFGGNKWSEGKMIGFQEMLDIIRAKYPGLRSVKGHKNDTSKTFEVPGFVGRVGFITSMTSDFCGTCNRLRITGDGNLKVCLHGNDEVSLRDILRQGNNGEPIDQEAFERIRQIEMDHREGLSDRTTLGWGERERELLEVIGVAVKKKAEKHADMGDLKNMTNRPMILIDPSIRPTQAHRTQFHPTPVHSTPSSRHRRSNSAPSASLLHTQSSSPLHLSFLYPSFTPSFASNVRALHNNPPKIYHRENSKGAYANAHEPVYPDIKLVLPKHSITPDLKFQARDGEARTREMAMLEALRAASKLDQGADQDQTPEGMSKKEYEKLLQDAKRVRGKSAGYAQQKLIRMAKRADLRKKMLEEGLDVTALEVDQKVGDDGEGDDIGKLMGEISSNVPVATEHKGRLPSVGDLVEKIRDLEARIELETLIPPSEDPGSWQEYHTLPEGKAIGRETKRALWRQRRKTAARVAKAETSGMDPKQRAKLEQKHQDEVEEMRRVLAQFKGFLEEYQRSSSSGTSARDLNARRQMDAVQESKRVVRERRERILKKKIRAQWVELREKEREMDYVSTDEWAVTGKEQYLNRDMLRIFKVPESNDKPKTNVPDGLTSSIRYTNTNNPPVSQTDSNPRTTVSSQPFVQQGHVPYSKTPLSPQIPTSQTTAPQPSPTEPDVLGPSYPLAPIPPPWPEPKQQRSLSENLKPSFPADGKVIIDDELTININSPVSDMQSQLFQLQDRLKNAYPGIEILPYEVWTSKNRSVLKTWLKIMTGKWTSRFDDVNVACSVVNGAWEGDMGLGEDVKGVLDAMVRDHDLTNEAAERMGKRWLEIFRQRRKIEGDSEGRSNMEEFDAQMGWLSDSNSKRKKDAGLGGGALAGVEVASENSGKKDEEKEGDSEHKEESMLPFTWTNKPSDGFRRAGKRSFSTTVRQYLPPKVPSPSAASDQSTTPTSATTTTSTSTSTPTLPHLTSSGSAHMVSVSAKSHTVRTAIAAGSVTFSNPVPLSLIRSNALKKGDVLSVSRIAGIMAAKRTPDLIPLCHPITLTHAGVELSLFDGASTGHGGVNIEAKVECTGATGVEMEALTAVTAAALTVVDMCKAVDKGMRIQDVRVVLKEGGRSGVWKEPSWVSMNK